jgi:hypothetical protein
MVVTVEVRFRFKSRSGRGQWDIIMPSQVEVGECIGAATSAATSRPRGLVRPKYSKFVCEYNAASDLVRYRYRPRRRSI